MGFKWNMPLEVVFGPTCIGGIGRRHLYIKQGCQKTSVLLLRIRQHSRLGKMVWTAIQWIQVIAGVGFALLAEPWSFLIHAVGQCFSSLRDFLADSECTIEIANTYTVCTRRVHDRILMERNDRGLHRQRNAGNQSLPAVSSGRCLSDVCTADGLTTDP
jgi:hypothetical protein